MDPGFGRGFLVFGDFPEYLGNFRIFATFAVRFPELTYSLTVICMYKMLIINEYVD
jgi:hypothetical protein